jgi:hypothetical protein
MQGVANAMQNSGVELRDNKWIMANEFHNNKWIMSTMNVIYKIKNS